MSRTFARQDAQIRNSVTYDDSIVPSEANYETNPTNVETDLNTLRSRSNDFLNRDGASFPTENWWDAITQPTTLENGTARGINATNAALHLIEKKRTMRAVSSVVDITVGTGQNFQILGAGELPVETTAAVGAVTTIGTICAFHSGTFGTHSLDEVAGQTAISPKNLLEVFDGSTRDPILDSSGRRIWALIQTETATDGHTITNTTPYRAQLSFVVINSTGDDLEACAVADIEDAVVNVSWPERIQLESLTEQDFLRGAIADIPSGTTVTRQVAYDNQGVTPVDLSTNAILDLESAGLEWQIRDDLEAILFRVIEGSAGGTSKVAVEDDVDEFDVDAVVSDYLNGIKVDTGAAGTTINIGITANQIDSGGALTVASGGAGDLTLESAVELFFDDGNRSGSGFSVPLKLTEDSAEWDQLETDFGEVSLAEMLHQAYSRSNRHKEWAVVTASTIAADTNVTGAGGSPNIDTQLPDYSGVTSFVYDVDVMLNGEMLRNGADAAANNDVYPGDTAANGDLKFEFELVGAPGNPDTLCVVVWG